MDANAVPGERARLGLEPGLRRRSYPDGKATRNSAERRSAKPAPSGSIANRSRARRAATERGSRRPRPRQTGEAPKRRRKLPKKRDYARGRVCNVPYTIQYNFVLQNIHTIYYVLYLLHLHAVYYMLCTYVLCARRPSGERGGHDGPPADASWGHGSGGRYGCADRAAKAARQREATGRADTGWHYLSNATCLMRPHSFYACFVVSRIITSCQVICRV